MRAVTWLVCYGAPLARSAARRILKMAEMTGERRYLARLAAGWRRPARAGAARRHLFRRRGRARCRALRRHLLPACPGRGGVGTGGWSAVSECCCWRVAPARSPAATPRSSTTCRRWPGSRARWPRWGASASGRASATRYPARGLGGDDAAGGFAGRRRCCSAARRSRGWRPPPISTPSRCWAAPSRAAALVAAGQGAPRLPLCRSAGAAPDRSRGGDAEHAAAVAHLPDDGRLGQRSRGDRPQMGTLHVFTGVEIAAIPPPESGCCGRWRAEGA